MQSFNDTASVNGKVAGSGGKSAASPQGASRAGGLPDGVQTADGTANQRADTKTLRAEGGSRAAGGSSNIPATVRKYKADSV